MKGRFIIHIPLGIWQFKPPKTGYKVWANSGVFTRPIILMKEAENEMNYAKHKNDIEALATSIQRAQDVGVNENTVNKMKKMLDELREATDVCEKAAEATDMDTAIATAQKLGISGKVLSNAKMRLQRLWDEKKQEAVNKMKSAEQEDNIETLATCIQRAQNVSVDQNAMNSMRSRYIELLCKAHTGLTPIWPHYIPAKSAKLITGAKELLQSNGKFYHEVMPEYDFED